MTTNVAHPAVVPQAGDSRRMSNLVSPRVTGGLRSSGARRANSAPRPCSPEVDGLLGRPVDPGGTRTYLPRVKQREYAAVLLAIIESREFRSRLPR